MGAILQIRVSAVTFDPSRVAGTWPRLLALAYPVEATAGQEMPGVLELVATLADRVRLDDLPAQDGFDPRPGIRAVSELALKLEAALADRDPRAADALSYAIEDGLTELERGLG